MAISAIEAEHSDWEMLLDLAKQEMQQVPRSLGLVLVHLWGAIQNPEQLAAAAEMANVGGYRFLLRSALPYLGPKLLGEAKPSIPLIAISEPANALRICVLGPFGFFAKTKRFPASLQASQGP